MDLTATIQEMYQSYRTLNANHPILGSMLTAEIIFPLSDTLSQYLVRGKENICWEKVKYTAALAPLYGTLAYLCMQSADLVPEVLKPRSLAKAALGPNLWGNAFNAFFFVNAMVGEKNGYQLSSLVKHYSSIFFPEKSEKKDKSEKSNSHFFSRFKEIFLDYIPREEYAKATLGTLTFWNAFQCINYAYVSRELQTPATLAVTLGWTVLLSAWSLRGGKNRLLK